MTILDAVFVFIAALLGFAIGAFLTAASYADDCLQCKREMWQAVQLDRLEQKQNYKNYCEDYCFDCKHYNGTIDFGKCDICDGYVEATDYCLSWEARKDVQI